MSSSLYIQLDQTIAILEFVFIFVYILLFAEL